MSEPKLRIEFDGDEQYEITYDEKHVASVNHDMHGWAGIDAVIDAVTTLAKYADIEVEEV